MAPSEHELLQLALHELDGLLKFGPRKPLAARMASAFESEGFELTPSGLQWIWDEIASDVPSNPIRLRFGECLRRFDAMPAEGMFSATAPLSVERRTFVYSALDLPAPVRARLDVVLPRYEASRIPTVIAERHEPWYSLDRRTPDFYWRSYRSYLRDVGHWPDASLDELDLSASLIVGRLSDPLRLECYSVRGLVVGYVQSGKTANFTAVVAKAADAGYRLIIVMAGVLDILREQTQRRIDKELVGKEAIRRDLMGDEYDYFGDKDWNEFVAYEGRESEHGHFEWRRITTAGSDYNELRHRVGVLRFGKTYPDRAFNDRSNLMTTPCRLVVIKKNSQVLMKLVRDLTRMKGDLSEIPVLLIDDESDQASLNVARQSAGGGVTARKGVNKAILGLLKLLPRGQYLGYTATPFANVLTDSSDSDDLFPRDFIVALKRPSDYMGVRDFFDLAPDLGDLTGAEKPQGYASRENSFVRLLSGGDGEPPNLPAAVDAFLLSGAIKLFRMKAGCRVGASKHHTMLVHISTRVADHEALSQDVRSVYSKATSNRARLHKRLAKLLDEEFRPTWAIWGDAAPMPDSYAELEPWVDECLQRVSTEPVRVVNSDASHAHELPRFDKAPVWSILVGGSKLSRGYTVEGLTISYYRRRIQTADTLMQVGRWFGFRHGYRDLVRLFVESGLYDDFKSICRDEEVFRQELDRYVDPRFDPPLRPRDVPPLVPSHRLRPTAANKMQSARVTFQNLSGQWKEKVSQPLKGDERKGNAVTFASMLRAAAETHRECTLGLGDRRGTWRAHVWTVSRDALVKWLDGLRWLQGQEGSMERERKFLTSSGPLDPQVDRFHVILPQRATAAAMTWQPEGLPALDTFERSRTSSGAFQGFSESGHRAIAPIVAGVNPLPATASPETVSLVQPRTGVLLVYPVDETPAAGKSGASGKAADQHVAIGFGIQFPTSTVRALLMYEVSGTSRP